MKKILGALVGVAIIGGGYFGAKSMGFLGEKTLSPAEISEAFTAHSAGINAEGGVKYGGFATLTKATHTENEITITVAHNYTAEKIKKYFKDSFMGTTESMSTIRLCGDVTTRAALAGGAVFVYDWVTSDDVSLGQIRISGATYCVDKGYLKASSG